jgi:chromosome partitioning protein
MGSGIDKRGAGPQRLRRAAGSRHASPKPAPKPQRGLRRAGRQPRTGRRRGGTGATGTPRTRLKAAMATVASEYDFVLIDCPPSLSLLTLNGLCAAHGVIVPMQCEYFALEGLSDLVNTIKQVHANLNPDLHIIGLLRVMFDPRVTLQQQVSEQLKAHFGDKVFNTVIPRNVRLAEAPSYGQPGVVFDPSPRAPRPSSNSRARWWPGWAAAVDARHDRSAAVAQDAGLNASAPPQQRGWTAGWCASTRARPSAPAASMPWRPAACRWTTSWRRRPPVFRAAGLPLVVRITPFSLPPDWTTLLASAGLQCFDDTRVLVSPPRHDGSRPAAGRPAPASAGRPTTPQASAPCAAHRPRSSRPTPSGWPPRRCPTAAGCCAAPTARCWPAGSTPAKATMVGLYDVFTAPAARNQRLSRALCAELLRRACGRRRHTAYLQVDGGNAPCAGGLPAAGLRIGYALPLPGADPNGGLSVRGARSPTGPATRRRPGARSSPAPRRRWRPCPGCPGAPSAALAVVGEDEESTRLVSLQACTSKKPSPAWPGRAAASRARSARRRSAARRPPAPLSAWRPAQLRGCSGTDTARPL